jgi:hypothetical protein
MIGRRISIARTFDGVRSSGDNTDRSMTRPAFSIVIPQCGVALSGELHMGVVA